MFPNESRDIHDDGLGDNDGPSHATLRGQRNVKVVTFIVSQKFI